MQSVISGIAHSIYRERPFAFLGSLRSHTIHWRCVEREAWSIGCYKRTGSAPAGS